MSEVTKPAAANRMLYWGGWVMSVLPALMLFMSAGFKLTGAQVAVEGFKAQGFPDGALFAIGVVELLITLIYLVPQTAVLGAILLTGYLGGAVVVHVRMSEPFFFPIVLGVLLWGGLFLRDSRVRALIPLVR